MTQLHVFSYSERPGTQALKIEYVVSPEEKHQRSQRLLTLSDQKTQAFYARHIGQVMPVLMEKSKTGVPMHGFTENYIRVEVEMMIHWIIGWLTYAWETLMKRGRHLKVQF